ncbi:MAG TPA: imidazolonepropionase, partial [Gemmatimonadaceae bacterium]|nr:imidazolonepropionase [Gemmatimonadaceae bacterium]
SVIVSSLLFVNAAQVVTCAGPARARRGPEMREAGVLRDAAVAVEGDEIAAVGPREALERAYPAAERVDCAGCVLTPGLVDSHTHAIFGKPRYEEQELRAAGVGYMEIARRGGGIHASVRDVRARDEEELVALARARLLRIASYGATTVEVKSGYGLTVEDELKLLRVIARLAAELPLRLVPTWLGAHEIPPEARATPSARDSYVNMLVHTMLPLVVRDRLARFADVFCEPGVFTLEETRTILEAARAAGLLPKLHADELEPAGGAELAARLGAISADHLAAISDGGIAALASAGTVATLLPGTMLFLGRERQAPARRLIDGGAAVALASDFNPGTSPTVNFPLVLTLGVSQLRMSVAEVLVAATVNGAAALALADRVGQLAPGFSADLALFEADDVRELPYWYGDRRCRGTWTRGKPCHPYELRLT